MQHFWKICKVELTLTKYLQKNLFEIILSDLAISVLGLDPLESKKH